MVTRQNYEEYMMMLVDGELSKHEEQELMAFVAKHPELKSELAAFNMVKLEPATDIVFENKEQLMKSVSSKRVIAFPVWQRYSIAAGVAAIISITLFKFNTNDNKVASVTESAPVKKVAPIAEVKTIVPAVTPIQAVNAPVTEEHAPVSAQQIAKVESVKSMPRINKVVGTKKKVEAANFEIVDAVVVTFPKINAAEPVGLRFIDSDPAATMALKEAPALALVGEVESPERGSFFKNLGIEEGKREGMEAVATAVTHTLDKVHSIKKDIDSRSLSVRIENKRLILSF